MRLTILMPVASPWARQIVGQLCRLGHEVHIVDFERSGEGVYLREDDSFQADAMATFRSLVSGSSRLKTRFRSSLRYLTCSPQIQRICQNFKSDVLVSLYGGGWALLAYASGVRPFAVYTVGSDVLLAKHAHRWVSRLTLSAATVVFSNGQFLSEKTRKLAPRANVVPLLIGIDTKRFTPVASPPEPVKLVCTRGFLPVYNNESVIHALKLLPASIPDFELVFTSTGPTLAAIRELADRTLAPTMRRRLTFLGGVTDEELLAKLQNAHVYLSLSRSDGTSTSLLEALSCSLFPVLSDIPPNREWVEPADNNGILVGVNDAGALAQALVRAITDSELRGQATEMNRRQVLQRADAERSAAVLESTFESLLNSRSETCDAAS